MPALLPRGFCDGYPYAQKSALGVRAPSLSSRLLEVRELNDAYVLFLDMPGEQETFSSSTCGMAVQLRLA